MVYVIGIDVGGTFTDAFLADDQGFVTSAKEPSTPPDYSQGVLNCLRELARQMDLTLTDLLANAAHIVHGTTASLNAVLTGTTAIVEASATTVVIPAQARGRVDPYGNMVLCRY